jgi:hypothetical protein
MSCESIHQAEGHRLENQDSVGEFEVVFTVRGTPTSTPGIINKEIHSCNYEVPLPRHCSRIF